MENSATPRQRWALYCITKKDYRNVILSKEEATKLIKELGDPNYKKAKNIVKTKSIKDELFDYLKSNIDNLYNECLTEMGYESIVELNNRPYNFVGCGCGITWLTYRKNNMRAEEIDNAARSLRTNEILNLLIKKLPKKLYNELKNKGCPFEAVWSQMQNLQCAYYDYVIEFAKNRGISMSIKSVLD